jgi:hypothetical protein
VLFHYLKSTQAGTPFVLADALRDDFPQVGKAFQPGYHMNKIMLPL